MQVVVEVRGAVELPREPLGEVLEEVIDVAVGHVERAQRLLDLAPLLPTGAGDVLDDDRARDLMCGL